MNEDFDSEEFEYLGPPVPKLGGNVKYYDWEKHMIGRLLFLGATGIVRGTEIEVTLPENPSATQILDYKEYQKTCYRAAGEIYLALDEVNKNHVHDVCENSKLMWDRLKEIHWKSTRRSRYHALKDLFSIRLKDGESLTHMAARVQLAMDKVKSLRPKDYTIKDMDEDLLRLSIIRGLPRGKSHRSFIQSLLSEESDLLSKYFHT